MLSNSISSAGAIPAAQSASPSPLAYTIDDVVKYCRVGRTKVFEAIRDGKLRAVKNGRRTLILTDDLYYWLDNLHVVQPREVRAA